MALFFYKFPHSENYKRTPLANAGCLTLCLSSSHLLNNLNEGRPIHANLPFYISISFLFGRRLVFARVLLKFIQNMKNIFLVDIREPSYERNKTMDSCDPRRFFRLGQIAPFLRFLVIFAIRRLQETI